MFKSVPGCIEGIPGHYGMFGGIMGCSRGVSGLFQAVPGCSSGVPGVFRGCSGGVPGVFRVCSGFYRHPKFSSFARSPEKAVYHSLTSA